MEPPGDPENKVVGVICSGNVAADRDQVKSLIEKGITQRPGAVWVCLEPKSDRMTHDVMISLGIEPVVLPLNPAWKRKPLSEGAGVPSGSPEQSALPEAGPAPADSGYDLRRQWRDNEMLLCDELIVFHKRTGSSPWRDRHAHGYHDNLFVVELGPEPVKKARKPRKPVGA